MSCLRCLLSLLLVWTLAGCDGPTPAADPDVPPPSDDTFVNSAGMQFVKLPLGTFEMGSTTGDPDEQPVHDVTLTRDFYIGKYEVTQGQWHFVMRENPSRFTDNETRPVEQVSWHDVQTFIEALNAMEGGTHYRLPTEAEWEYAARGGTDEVYSFGADLDLLPKYAWFSFNSSNTTQPVGRKRPNPYGLYDMHGNVWEWIQDHYHPDYYRTSKPSDPLGPEETPWRVIRGGGGFGTTSDLRSANRGWSRPELSDGFLGFRLVREIDTSP